MLDLCVGQEPTGLSVSHFAAWSRDAVEPLPVSPAAAPHAGAIISSALWHTQYPAIPSGAAIPCVSCNILQYTHTRGLEYPGLQYSQHYAISSVVCTQPDPPQPLPACAFIIHLPLPTTQRNVWLCWAFPRSRSPAILRFNKASCLSVVARGG